MSATENFTLRDQSGVESVISLAWWHSYPPTPADQEWAFRETLFRAMLEGKTLTVHEGTRKMLGVHVIGYQLEADHLPERAAPVVAEGPPATFGI